MKVVKRICFIFIALALLAAICIVGGYYGYRFAFGESLDDTNQNAKAVVENSTPETFTMNKTTYVYAKDKSTLAKLSVGESQNYLSYAEIPQNVVNAFVAVEDRTYWENSGVDLKGIARATLSTVKNRKVTGGASTITQQLARKVFLSQEKTIRRKINEIFISYYLTQRYSKEEIMEYYVNNCCFANNIYGIKDASEQYLGKSVEELTLSETAYLCAIPNRPQSYDPYKDPDAAMSRRNKILDDMLELGYITNDEYNIAINEGTPEIKEKKNKIYNYATSTAIYCATRQLMKLDDFEFQYSFKNMKEYKSYKKKYDEAYEKAKEKLYTGGYKIYTTLDKDIQHKVQTTVDNSLKGYGKGVQASITVIDNDTGKVVASVGGKRSDSYTLNRSIQSFRQPGSSIKPLIIYAPALDQGIATPSTMLKNVDVKTAYKNQGNVKNLRGNKVTFKGAVRNSLNGCAIYLYDQVGVRTGLSYAQKMTFSHIVPDDYHLSSGLGGLTYGTNTFEMANAYSTLANGGKFRKADCIKKIVDASGENVYKKPKSKQVYSKNAANDITEVLKDVVKYGTASSMGWNHSAWAAGKTGTTNDTKDGWFCGYTKDYTVTVWVGKDNHDSIPGLYGGTLPADMWKSVQDYLVAKK